MATAAGPVAIAALVAAAASLHAVGAFAQNPPPPAEPPGRAIVDPAEPPPYARRPLPRPAAAAAQTRPTLTVTGQLLVNSFYNSGKTNNSDVPTYADTLTPADPAGLPTHNLGAAVRQSRLALTVSGTRALGASITGFVQVDFFGGQQPSTGGRTYPLPRIRVASVRADWARVSVLVGQDALVIAPVSPVSYASFATPLFAHSGNLWFRAPQLRVTAETLWHARVGVQAAALAPLQPSAQGPLLTQPDSAERSALPSLEGRLYAKWGRAGAVSEVGFAGHVGWLATTGDTLLRSQAVAVDARIAVGPHLTLAGEAFSGEAIGALGGAIAQNLGRQHVPVGSRGGWFQADVHPGAVWQFGGGFGIDHPVAGDLAAGGRRRNVTWAGHLVCHTGGGLLLGAEFRRIETAYATRTLGVTHLNGYAGLSF